ncbi:MAG: tetratricopeptide (TPR) repeat protein [Cyclobacteriaceae bacterium]|jgi:tetratricopeptide (TPR) repeat protein
MNRFILILAFFSISSIMMAQKNVYLSRSERNKKSAEYYDLATELYQNGKHDKAIRYYDSAISLNLRRLDYYLSRAEAKEMLGNYVAALVDYAAVIEIDYMDPYAINAYFKRGLIYHRHKNYASAIEDFTHLLNIENFGETRTLIFKGEQQNEGGEVKFAGVTTVDKMKGEVFNARAKSYQMTGEREKALADFEKAITENSLEPNYYINRGLYWLHVSDTASAKVDFVKALEIRAGYKPALYNLSKISSVKERASLDDELYVDNEVSVVFSQRAYDKFLNGDYRGALKDYDSALFWMPKNAEDLMNRGIVKSKLRRPRSAIADFDESIKTDKKLYRNYVLIGNAFQVLKDYKKAVAYYDFYLGSKGVDAQVLYNKGVAELKLGNRKQACQDLTRALQMGEKRAVKAKESACR